MTAIGSLVFCNDCGNLLDARTSAKVKTLNCAVCGSSCKGLLALCLVVHVELTDLPDTSAKVVITRSKPSDLPSSLRAKRSEVQTVNEQDVQQNASIRETCPNCGQEEVRYYTQQLRSADEGSTVFYECPKCGHKWNQNN